MSDRNVKFRLASIVDINQILAIIKDAQNFLEAFNIDQWQNNYPNKEVITVDINNEESYVVEIEGEIVATLAIIFRSEATYNNIYQGSWLSDQNYVTIHRIAIDNKYKGKGISTLIIEEAEKLALKKDIWSIRVDTHTDNIMMQKYLLNNNFVYCGIIYLNDNSERLAYEKIIY